MFQQPHDQFAKQFLSELLQPLGADIKVNYEVHAQSHYVDIYFSPKPANLDSKLLDALGLLGKIASHACLIEPFRSPVTQEDVCNCLLKLFLVHNKIRERHKQQKKQQRKLKRQDLTIPETEELPLEELPQLWILSTSVSEVLISRFGANPKPQWGDGVYFLPEAFNTRIIAIDRLPQTLETLYLRMLGKNGVQKQAIEEFLALLPQTAPLREYVLKLLFMYRIYLDGKSDLSKNEKELFMNLSQIYQKWETETIQKARQDAQRELIENFLKFRSGTSDDALTTQVVDPSVQQAYLAWEQETLQKAHQDGQRMLVENLLKSRFGTLDDALTQIIDPLLQLPPDKMSPLLFQANREELLAKFQQK